MAQGIVHGIKMSTAACTDVKDIGTELKIVFPEKFNLEIGDIVEVKRVGSIAPKEK